MSVSAWLGRPGCLSSPPESSHVGGGHSPSCQRPNVSDSPEPSSRFGAAGAHSVARALHRGLAAALLSVPLFAGLTGGAAAQSVVECRTADTDGTYLVPKSWALTTTGDSLTHDSRFRLLFVTSTTRDATATDIATYNTFVQTRAKAGHSAISDSCGNLFKVVGSTATVAARDNAGTTGAGAAIYWLGGVGAKAANDNTDFHDGTWDNSTSRTNENGASSSSTSFFTGSSDDGTAYSGEELGTSGANVRTGSASGGLDGGGNSARGTAGHFLALSPVFKVHAETASFESGTLSVDEGDDIRAKIVMSGARTVDTSFSVHTFDGSAEGGDDFVAGPYTVVIPAGKTEVTLSVPTVQDNVLEYPPDENLLLRLFVTDSDVDEIAPDSTTVTIVDDEYTITFDPAIYNPNETDGFVNVTGTLSRALKRAVIIPFSYEHLGGGVPTNQYPNFRPVPRVTVPAGETSFTLRIQILDNELFEDNDLVAITGPITVQGGTSARADIVITDDETERGYATHEASDGSYTCISQGRNILVDDQSGGTIAVQQPGWWVGQPPPGLVVDWDRDNYAVGDTATITFRTSDGSRSCAGIEFWLSVSQSPHQTWNNGLPPQPPVLQFPRDSHRVFVTLGRGQTEVSRSFRVLAPGMAIFQIKKVSNRTPWNLGRLGAKLRDMPTPVDRDGTALTVSRDLWGPGAATEVSATVHPGVYFQSASQEVQEDVGTVNLTVAVSPPPATPRTLAYGLSGTANPGHDYNTPNRTGNTDFVTIPANAGSVTIPVTIIDDNVDDDGETIVVRLASVSGGYRVATPGSVTLTTRNHDPVPEPEVSIAAGAGVTEGGSASFTLTADPAPTAPLDVSVTIAAEGEFGIAAGERTVTIPATGSYELTLATAGDGVDEPNGSVTATVDAGNGYTVGAASSGTVAIADDDALSAAHPLVKHAPVVKRFHDRITARNQHGNSAAGGWNKRFLKAMGHPDYVAYPQAAVTVADATRIWNHGGPGANTGWNGTVEAVTYAERYFAGQVTPPDPALIPEISIAAGAAITEGGDAVFTVTADRAPDANLSVALTVSEAAGSDFVAAADEGAKTVTIPAGETAGTLTVRTEDDRADEPDGSVTATLAAGSGYTVAASPRDAASVAVADNDAAGALPVLSVESKSVQEGNGKVTLWATIDPLPSKAAFPELHRTTRLKLRTIEGTAWDGVDYVGIPAYFGITEACNFHTTLAPNGKHGCRIDEVTILDDSHDDGGETFQLEVGFADSEPAPLRGLGAARGTVTIENSDPLPAAYLARFGRTVAEQALDGIAGRMSASRTPGMQGTVAGQSLSFDPAASGQPAAGGATPGTPGAIPADREAALAMAGIARGLGAEASAPAAPGSAADSFGAGFGDSRFGTPPLQSRSMTARDALLGSSFSLTGQKDGAGGSLAFWGRASQASFDGAERGDGTDIRLDGTVTTGMLGADYARGKWLVGLALTQSSSDGSYAAIGDAPCPDTDSSLCDGAVRAGDGDVEASLTAAIPYAALQVSERLKLWGAAGYGTGEVTLKTMDESYKADTSWSMAAAGVRGDLLEAPKEGSGPALALTSDALWARTSSEKTRDLAATDSDATRLRLGLEGRYRLALDGEASLTPKLEIGARHDGGDAETGFGVELGGGLAWSAPGLGFSLDVSGRTLLAHENDDLKDRGMSASLAFDPAPATQRGPSFSLRQDFGGQARGGLDALFAPAPLEDRTGGEAASRWAMEAAYGFPAFGGRFTGSPHVGLGLSTGARDYSVGWRLAPEAATATDLSFGVKASRRESDTAEPEHTVGFEATVRW